MKIHWPDWLLFLVLVGMVVLGAVRRTHHLETLLVEEPTHNNASLP